MKFKLLSVMMSVTAFGCVFIYNKAHSVTDKPEAMQQIIQQTVVKQANLPQVGVISVNADTYRASVTGLGEVTPRYKLNLTSDVSGKVVSLSDKFSSGQILKKGDILATIEDSTYQAQLAQAQAQVAQAELELAQEKRQGEVAYQEWLLGKDGGQKATPLVLRKPQLAAAKANLAYAQQALNKAQVALDNTIIKAPFDALVVARDIQLGSYLSANTSIGVLYDIERVEISIPLSERQWQELNVKINGELEKDLWPVGVELANNNLAQWRGYVSRIESHIDTNTRQRSVIVVVEQPLAHNEPLFAGSFVKVTLQGVQDELFKLPASAISQSGDVWFVDEQGQLHKQSANKVFSKDSSVYVKPLATQPLKIVKRPLSHFVEGMMVKAVDEALL
ncbi:efflux RND transporter periplasmic adaptor subunit [Pseudoalteromonas sp. T1lg23B]|uniref:efflux RND transporter periplasmic adaptor subunit n=1 Tax=Pseudoalteromonas sp. T1lg23B TaxID=2077097 RepID=UPI00131A2EE0|nr:efflux RND transporter periplasmic adaptor subunit [Pseudoalteromonas sp. T1lg23B]